jgi:hypothetical protein
LYTKQHAVETNLFLAPGEGDDKPETAELDAASNSGGALPDAIRVLRGNG